MKDNKVYLVHILDCIERIKEYTAEGKEHFKDSLKTQDAVIRNLEIIGEATKRISLEYRNKYPYIPWRQMAALRDVLIHDYMGVDINIVWNVVEKDIPELEKLIRKVF